MCTEESAVDDNSHIVPGQNIFFRNLYMVEHFLLFSAILNGDCLENQNQ